jgi:hypothetical protein
VAAVALLHGGAPWSSATAATCKLPKVRCVAGGGYMVLQVVSWVKCSTFDCPVCLAYAGSLVAAVHVMIAAASFLDGWPVFAAINAEAAAASREARCNACHLCRTHKKCI